MAVCRLLSSARRGSSIMMKSMNSGTPASVALPERSSRGMMMSASMRTVSHSCGREELRLERRRRPGRGRRACAPGQVARRQDLVGGPREPGGQRRRAEQLQHAPAIDRVHQIVPAFRCSAM